MNETALPRLAAFATSAYTAPFHARVPVLPALSPAASRLRAPVSYGIKAMNAKRLALVFLGSLLIMNNPTAAQSRQTLRLPARPHLRHRRRLPRHQGRRPLPPARRPGLPTSPRAWVEAENKVTFGYLESIPEREAIRQTPHRALELREVRRPRRGRRSLLLLQQLRPPEPERALLDHRSLDEERQLLIDPNTLSEDGTVALAGGSVSR